ncbi:MAG: hypothetical protein MUC68_02605 [Burkholderiaceae bacterium]|nr:hypothetical protein [Burkholderiaceae bacterium]
MLGVAAWIEPSVARGLALAVAAASTAVALRSACRAPVPIELRVDADGIIWHRPLTAADAALPAAVRLRPVFAGSRLCCLSDSNARALAVWHDGLPVERYRALCAHARWHVERARDDAPVGSA